MRVVFASVTYDFSFLFFFYKTAGTISGKKKKGRIRKVGREGHHTNHAEIYSGGREEKVVLDRVNSLEG